MSDTGTWPECYAFAGCRTVSPAPLEPAAVSNLFCAWSKGTLTYLTLMFLLAASNWLTRALYVGASLVALEVSHQVTVTGPSDLSLPLPFPPGARQQRWLLRGSSLAE